MVGRFLTKYVFRHNVSNFNQINFSNKTPLDRYSGPLCALFCTPSHSHPRTSYKYTSHALHLYLAPSSTAVIFTPPHATHTYIHLPLQIIFTSRSFSLSHLFLIVTYATNGNPLRGSLCWCSCCYCFLFLFFTLLLLLLPAKSAARCASCCCSWLCRGVVVVLVFNEFA